MLVLRSSGMELSGSEAPRPVHVRHRQGGVRFRPSPTADLSPAYPGRPRPCAQRGGPRRVTQRPGWGDPSDIETAALQTLLCGHPGSSRPTCTRSWESRWTCVSRVDQPSQPRGDRPLPSHTGRPPQDGGIQVGCTQGAVLFRVPYLDFL